MITVKFFILFIILTSYTTQAQINNWLKVIKDTKVSVKYFSPAKSETFNTIKIKNSRENELCIIKEFTDDHVNVILTFKKYNSHVELFGEIQNLQNEDLCLTLKLTFRPLEKDNIVWSYDLDSSITVKSNSIYSNFIDTKTIIPPAGAFNISGTSNGGYGDKLGTGKMSFFPLAAISSNKTGLGWAVDMGIPVVFRLSYNTGMDSEFDLALSKETKKIPNRTFFKLLLFEYDPAWKMRAALDKYYQLQPEYFKRRITQEGIWLPFAPLYKIKRWEDFGFAFHETNWRSIDNGLSPPVSSIQAGKSAHVLTFQYTEPWEEEIPIKKLDLTYEEVIGDETISESHSEYLATSAALDKENKLITRKLETPWFPTGWAVSINTNTDPDIKGFNRSNYINKTEIDPAIEMNVDGIYFDCLEWHWQYDMNYNRSHFKYTDYPLTFSSSLEKPKPVIWSYSSDYEFINKVADEMHKKGKFVMGNSFYWIPFSAGKLDLFGSELSWYDSVDTKLTRLEFLRAMAYQKPAVFLLNVGLGDKAFTEPPYDGYRIYFEKMLFYGFFPSFFSEDASNNIYWADSVKYNTGRPFFKKYIPLIKEISQAGWQPITFAFTDQKELRIERFENKDSANIYFTFYNSSNNDINSEVSIDLKNLRVRNITGVDEMIKNKKIKYKKDDDTLRFMITVNRRSASLVRIVKQ